MVIGASISIQVWSQHNELLARFFKTALMSYRDGLILLAVSALPLIVLEIIKSFPRCRAGLGRRGRAGDAARPGAIGGRDGAPSDSQPRAKGLRLAHGGRGVVVLLAFGGGWLAWSLYRGTAPHYVTQKIERGSVVRIVTASGIVSPTATTPLVARVSGVVQALYCDANMKVKAGQLCAKIDPRPYQIVVDREKADLAAAETAARKGQGRSRRGEGGLRAQHQTLAKRRAVSRKALDKSRKAYERAQTQTKRDEAMVAQRQAALHAAEIDLGSTNIVSPIDGTVISRNVEIGQTVAAGARRRRSSWLPRISPSCRSTPMSARTTLARSNLGDKVSFTVEAFPNRPFAGEVTQIRQSPRTIQNVTTYDVVISAPNPDLLLKPGMKATIRIAVDRRDDVLRAPNQALRYSPRDLAVPSGADSPRSSPDGWSQLWILRDGKPTAITVQLGLDDGAYTEIVTGDMQSGDELIIGEGGGILEKQRP